MKTCPNCQKEYEDSMVFCVECGSKLVDFKPVIEESQPRTAEKRLCVNCGNEFTADAYFCTVCGSQLVNYQPIAEEPQLTVAETQLLVPEPRSCMNCGNQLDVNATFCTACGMKLIDSEGTQLLRPEIKCCVNCGNQLDNDDAFCTTCGTPVNSVNDTSTNHNVANGCTNQTASNVNTLGFNGYNINPAPIGQLKTNKGLLKSILFSLITFGIYPFVILSSVSNDINIVASRYDGKKTMHFCLLAFIIAPLTLGVGAIVWYHKISARIGAELDRRGIDYSFGATDYWLWNVLGTLIVIGPFVYLHKLFKAVNLMNADYNMKG